MVTRGRAEEHLPQKEKGEERAGFKKEDRRRAEEANCCRRESEGKAEVATKHQEETDRKKMEEWLATRRFHVPSAKKAKWVLGSFLRTGWSPTQMQKIQITWKILLVQNVNSL